MGKYLEFAIEFRTSEINGVLLSVAEPQGYPALSLELYMGNVVLSCDLGDGHPIHLETELASKFTLCDNQWHTVTALFNAEELAVRIDSRPPVRRLLRTSTNHKLVGKIPTKAPLYIGGLPGAYNMFFVQIDRMYGVFHVAH